MSANATTMKGVPVDEPYAISVSGTYSQPVEVTNWPDGGLSNGTFLLEQAPQASLNVLLANNPMPPMQVYVDGLSGVSTMLFICAAALVVIAVKGVVETIYLAMGE